MLAKDEGGGETHCPSVYIDTAGLAHIQGQEDGPDVYARPAMCCRESVSWGSTCR